MNTEHEQKGMSFQEGKLDKESTQEGELDWSFIENGHLYGRGREIASLQEAVFRSLSSETDSQSVQLPEFILISGKSGTGKTALARVLVDPVTTRGGFFVEGKFDQLQLPEPYAPIICAFTTFVQRVVEDGEETVAEVREALLKTIRSCDLCMLVEMIPALEQILGSDSHAGLGSEAKMKGAEVKTRQKIMFRHFVRAICSADRPLVLMMDDLQWADSGSLDLLHTLVSDGTNRNIVVIGVCRSNEVSFDHNFAHMLRKLEDEKQAIINHIELDNISYESTCSLVSDVLHLPCEECLSLAETVYFKTEGNVFFILQFMQALYEHRILVLGNNVGEKWHWDKDQLLIMQEDNDVLDFVKRKIRNLPAETQLVLKTLACIGAEIDEYLLSELFVDVDIAEAINQAVKEGVVHRNVQLHRCYAFSHDRFQQAAYCLIPEDQKASVHISIGRTLWKQLSKEELDMQLFLVVNQMSRGVGLLEDQNEKDALAILCLQAGQKAILASDFYTSTIYLWLGISLLGSRRWKDQYELCLDLFNTVADAEYCVGNFEQMEVAVEEVLEYAACFHDKIRAYSTQIFALGARARLQEAIDLGLSILERFGEKFPSKLSMTNLLLDMGKTKFMLHRKTDSIILKYPDIVNWEKVAAIQMLNLLTTYAFIARQELFPFIGNRMVQISIKYGLCAISALGFCMYGFMCCSMGDFKNGIRYGELGLKILERYKEKGNEWIPRVYMWFHGMMGHWKYPLRASLKALKLGHQVAMETGDIEYAMGCGFARGYNALYAGLPLDQVEEKLTGYLDMMTVYKQDTFATYTALVIQAIHNFRGKSNDPIIMTGELMNQEKLMKTVADENLESLLLDFNVLRLMLAFNFGNYELALTLAEETRKCNTDSSFVQCVKFFYDGLSVLGVAAEMERGAGYSSSKRTKRKLLSTARRVIRNIKRLSNLCPANCLNKLLLLEAEYAALQGKNSFDVALTKYDESIAQATKEGFLNEQALAYERAALFLNHYGDVSRADMYMEKAVNRFAKWGATAKVVQMKEHKNKCKH